MNKPFRHRMRVRYNECDPQGVVFNANYLTYFDITITEMWRELGGYQAMVDAGADVVVAEVRVRYRSALRFDEQFEVRATIARLGSTSITTEMVVDRDGETIAEGELRHVFIDPGGAKAPIPERIREGLSRFSPVPG